MGSPLRLRNNQSAVEKCEIWIGVWCFQFGQGTGHLRSIRSGSRENKNRRKVGVHGNLGELVFAGNFCVPGVRGRHHETVNSGTGIKKLLTLVMTIKYRSCCNKVRVQDKSGVHIVTRVCEQSAGPQFVYAVLVLIVESSGLRMLMAAPNREWEPKNFKPLKSELAASWAGISHALRGFYELEDILIEVD